MARLAGHRRAQCIKRTGPSRAIKPKPKPLTTSPIKASSLVTPSYATTTSAAAAIAANATKPKPSAAVVSKPAASAKTRPAVVASKTSTTTTATTTAKATPSGTPEPAASPSGSPEPAARPAETRAPKHDEAAAGQVDASPATPSSSGSDDQGPAPGHGHGGNGDGNGDDAPQTSCTGSEGGDLVDLSQAPGRQDEDDGGNDAAQPVAAKNSHNRKMPDGPADATPAPLRPFSRQA
ncbi:hypothetical protein GGTG_03632 [Gaeumannomyces tritici R3-111a-1]|uniref:Uncharacterized protein n=1 Tax=Gaeumannomyces tritici (strain R3-111a-1) TaxID=644352 RepID=J3NQS6_GAET3|nr:hypothetical protein GGTG_03632 [Gaeumannomyces tritici R3-111a-1]EJT78532.1 hypothetical protein GGTG_03632 [Gaeumannomyces tritici R3-111a-1]